ncbi:MAG: MATE family efflux transporter [Lachnospiraceae bacterium]|nr:MATE family efflux transporter [Lachnospiraceae bacterium]
MSNKENKMGTMPVKKLIVSMSVPMMISMLVQALYNVVDSIYVSHLSTEALTAVGIVFPLQNLMISVAMGTGVGINALLSKSLGEKNFETANKSANNGILLALISCLVFMGLSGFIVEPFIFSQTAKEGSNLAQDLDPLLVRKYGTEYGTICCLLSIGLFLQMTFERLLQSTGRTILSMISQMTGAIINIILDPILIFGLAGAPKLGIVGAAYATVCGQIVASVLAFILNIRFNKEIKFSFKEMIKPDAHVIGRIYQVGVPSILMMSIGSVMTYCLNIILNGFSLTAQTVYATYFKIQSFFFMPVFGLNGGSIPVLAYNYGAKNKERIKETLSFTVRLAVGIMLCGTLVFEIIPGILLSMFDATDEMIKIGVPALRIIAVHFPIAAVCIVLGSVFQAFSQSIYSLIVSLCRQLVVLIPVAWLLSLTGKLDLVWLSFPAAEIGSLIVTLIFFRKVMDKVTKHMEEVES